MTSDLRRFISLIETAQAPEAMTPAEAFDDAFEAAYEASGLSAKGHVALFHHGPRKVEITHIQTDAGHRGQGVGNAVMELLTTAADQHNVVLFASPASDADPEEGLGPQDLRDWYDRWGFEAIPGVDRMGRRPNKPMD